MEICGLCGKKCRSRRGLKTHITRTHGGRGKPDLLCMNLAFRFFAFLERSEWAAAERVWGKIREMELDGDWLKGYTNALIGMMVSLRNRTSHAQPYILEVREYEIGELQDVKRFFRKATERKMNKKFDKGFFQGWHQYIGFLLRKTKE